MVTNDASSFPQQYILFLTFLPTNCEIMHKWVKICSSSSSITICLKSANVSINNQLTWNEAINGRSDIFLNLQSNLISQTFPTFPHFLKVIAFHHVHILLYCVDMLKLSFRSSLIQPGSTGGVKHACFGASYVVGLVKSLTWEVKNEEDMHRKTSEHNYIWQTVTDCLF